MLQSYLTRPAAIAAIADPVAVMAALLMASALSRGLLAGMMRALPLASKDGLAAAAGRPGPGVVWSAAGLGGTVAVALFGPAAGIGALGLAGRRRG